MIPGILAGAPASAPEPGPGVSYRYWRIYCTATVGSSYFAIQEIEMYAGGSANLALGMTASASTSYGSNPPDRAVDGNYLEYTTHCWISNGSPMPQWWSVDLGAAYVLTSIVLFPQNYSEGPSRSAASFKVQGSNDDAAWFDVAAFSSIGGWVAGSGKTFAI